MACCAVHSGDYTQEVAALASAASAVREYKTSFAAGEDERFAQIVELLYTAQLRRLYSNDELVVLCDRIETRGGDLSPIETSKMALQNDSTAVSDRAKATLAVHILEMPMDVVTNGELQ
jgi:hypothetical protein